MGVEPTKVEEGLRRKQLSDGVPPSEQGKLGFEPLSSDTNALLSL
jgi:hypothetical protein